MNNVNNQIMPTPSVKSRLGNALGNVISRRFESVLDGFKVGQLTLTWPDGHSTTHGDTGESGMSANVVLHSFMPIKRLITVGQIGFAESYMRGEWNTDDLKSLFTIIMQNDKNIDATTQGSAFAKLFNGLQHWLKRNSVKGSQRNIAYHYDLGNDFYKLWLDDAMSYSSAIYSGEQQSLEDAQAGKQQKVLDLLQPAAQSRVLEIGCGWGSLASKIATDAGAHVTGVSLSREQLDYARDHNTVVTSDAATGSTNYQYTDYRALSGRFDHIVSIEMFEAVGQQYWSTYFNKLSELLDSGGTAVLQIITLLEDRFDDYRSQPDFIQRYIFPGGMLPTRTHLNDLLANSDFELVSGDWFGDSYARTLAAWRERFEAVSKDVQALNFDERFLRMWRYYLVYCELGFGIGRTDVGMLHIRKR